MSTGRRVHQEPAWLLHHRPFRDTSQLLEIMSRGYGRLSLVARGARASKSRLRGVLRPFLPLSMSWVIRTDLGTLTGAELDGAPISMQGESLLSAYYLNELLLNLLHRHDAQPEIFDAYGVTIRHLAAGEPVAATLRKFELELLRILGYAVNLDHDTKSSRPLVHDAWYEYRVEHGPVPVDRREGPMVFSGAELTGIRDQAFEQPEILRSASRLMRDVISFHLGGKELKSRKVLREMRKSRKTDVRSDGS